MGEIFEHSENYVNSDILEKLRYNEYYLIKEFVKISYDWWRKNRLQPDGTYESKWKESYDEERNKKHWTNFVDIANTEFEDLPSNRQYERLEAARVAINLVLDKMELWEEITSDVVEEMASIVHDRWLERNRWVYDEKHWDSMLAQSYESLPEEEKNKDRSHIYTAINIIKEEIKDISLNEVYL